jgi:putative sugar O-methyltransferase
MLRDILQGKNLDALNSMIVEVNKSSPLYRPTNIWGELTHDHLNWLKKFGIDNFKKTVNNFYSQERVLDREHRSFANIKHLLTQLTNIEIPPKKYVLEEPELFGNKELGNTYLQYVSMLDTYVEAIDSLGLFTHLSESLVGNPIRIRSGDRYISQDLAVAYLDLLSIIRINEDSVLNSSMTIAEVGAGYGCLTSIFGKLSQASYWVIDIPPALYVAQFYIKSIFPKERIFEFRSFSCIEEVEMELSLARFAFFTPNQIEMLRDSSIDIFMNINSFGEMTVPQVQNYMVHAKRLSRKGIYLRNYDDRAQSRGPSGQSFPIPPRSIYHPGPPWHCILDRDFNLIPGQRQSLYKLN